MQKVLIITNIKDISAAPRLGALREFVEALNKNADDVEFEYCAVQELVFILTDGVPSVQLRGIELKDTFRVVHLRNTSSYPFYAAAIGLYCKHNDVKVVNEGDVAVPLMDKVSQGFMFGLNGIKTPDLVSSPRNSELLEYLTVHPFEYPFILKHTMGIRGQDNYLIHDGEELTTVLSGDKHGFVAQPFIKNTGELRVLTFGADMDPLVFKKTAVSGSHLNNTAQGSEVQVLAAGEVEPELIETSIKISRLTGRPITGVDILFAENGDAFVLEANHTPSLATGVLAEKKHEYYIEFMSRLSREQSS